MAFLQAISGERFGVPYQEWWRFQYICGRSVLKPGSKGLLVFLFLMFEFVLLQNHNLVTIRMISSNAIVILMKHDWCNSGGHVYETSHICLQKCIRSLHRRGDQSNFLLVVAGNFSYQEFIHEYRIILEDKTANQSIYASACVRSPTFKAHQLSRRWLNLWSCAYGKQMIW